MSKETTVQVIEAYKTSDDQIFEDKNEAFHHEQDLLVKKKIKEFSNKHFWSGMIAKDLEDIIWENKAELNDALKGR